MHWDLPVLDWYVPSGHGLHCDALPRENSPVLQAVQMLEPCR
jgi:hypothetical protein